MTLPFGLLFKLAFITIIMTPLSTQNALIKFPCIFFFHVLEKDTLKLPWPENR